MQVTAVNQQSPPSAVSPPRRVDPVWAGLRNAWRQLTSMRTALVLLFLLAVAAIPGSVLPQRGVNREKVAAYLAAHPKVAPWLDRLGGFEVFAAPWFAAIYLLLFTSLVGCVLPRLADHVRALRTAPPDAPRRLDWLPQHTPGQHHPGDPATTAAGIASTLRARRFRTAVREQPDASWTVAAEKGYLKEAGNLLFHLALLAVLFGVAFGSWYGWHGNRLLVQGPDTAFCNTAEQYDETSFGARITAKDLPAFCVELTRFADTYQSTGQPKSFNATVTVDEGSTPRSADFSVNAPLRLNQANVYLLGHGYAPILRYTDRYGRQQTSVVPFLPVDAMVTSEGVAMFPDANINPTTRTSDPIAQIAFEGVYVPTVDPAQGARSIFPEERSPAIILNAYRGDLGLNSGIPRSVYSLDRVQLTNGQLKQINGPRPKTLRPGERWTLDDGTTLQFLGTRPFITISVRHDPAQPVVLTGAVAGLIGLMLSLGGHRRRVWFRITAAADPATGTRVPAASIVQAGGLPRADYPGFADEYTELVVQTRAGPGQPHSGNADRR
jgi:cytochrome c biogenesis protein